MARPKERSRVGQPRNLSLHQEKTSLRVVIIRNGQYVQPARRRRTA